MHKSLTYYLRPFVLAGLVAICMFVISIQPALAANHRISPTKSQVANQPVSIAPVIRRINDQAYHLTFNSEFSGAHLNTAQWQQRAVGPTHRQGGIIFSPKSTWLDGSGNLVLGVFTKKRSQLKPDIAKMYKDSIRWIPFSSMLRTKKSFTYGYYTFRVKMPIVKGVGMAVWMQSKGMTDQPPSLDGSGGAEIDLIEQSFFDRSGNPTDYKHTTVHWGGYGKHHQYITIGVIDGKKQKVLDNSAATQNINTPTADGKLLTREHRKYYSNHLNFRDNQFHTISLLWTPEFYKFYYDHELIGTIRQGISHAPEYIILWPRLFNFHKLYAHSGKALGSRKTTPAQYLVDYVRVYQLSNTDALTSRPQR